MAKIQIQNDKSNDLTIIEVSGDVTLKEIIATVQRYYANNPTHALIWDFSKTDSIQLDLGGLEHIVDIIKAFIASRPHGRTAFVKSKQVNAGLASLFKGFAGVSGLPYEYRICSSREDALDWINQMVY